MSEITGNSTVGQAKQYLKKNWKDGVSCTCCNQYVKLYRRMITSAMAYGLILMVKEHDRTKQSVFHLENFFKTQDCPSSICGDITKLKYWGILYPMKRTGEWGVTQKGYDFAKGSIWVPKYVHVFNQDSYGFSKETTTIEQSLGDSFDIVELLADELIRHRHEEKQ